MLLRNYDNFKALLSMCGDYNNARKVTLSNQFGDGHISFKNINGAMCTKTSFYAHYNPFGLFYPCDGGATSGNSTAQSYLICGYIGEDEVGYDDYDVANKATGLKYISHSTSAYQTNNNEVESTYTKVFYNKTDADITINCIGISYFSPFDDYAMYLVYKEKIPETVIPAGANVVLTFTTKAPLGQNKPADYVASASVE